MAVMPHCDSRVLHAPGECRYCDGYPDFQRARELWGINFTGHRDANKTPCPAEIRRSKELIDQWLGNRVDGYDDDGYHVTLPHRRWYKRIFHI